MNQHLAHSENSHNKTHLISEHSDMVGSIMAHFSINRDSKEIFEFTGNYHDIGKYQLEFQEYLKKGGRKGSVPHAIWGAIYAKEKGLLPSVFAIDGHHRGLQNRSSLQADLTAYLKDKKKYDSLVEARNKDVSAQPRLINNHFFTNLSTKTLKELFIRYLFSSLVDADWLDTEAHFNDLKSEQRDAPEFNANYFEDCLDKQYAQFGCSELNILRTTLREYALSKAEMPQGFFSLTLPTGMGKTLCSIAWAIRHAKKHNLKRIIVVLPYISIIDQTAMTLKSLLGDEYILEHHSNVEIKHDDGEKYDTKQLATENWDYPIIVTTAVQFFESLFANSTSACRKVHNIKESIIIFDEVQTLPAGLITPTLTMLKDIQMLLSTTFLFCTATQPAFERRDGFELGIEKTESLVKNPAEVFKLSQRVKYRTINNYQPIDLDELSDIVQAENCAALVIFNTKKKAVLFHNLVCNDSYRSIHLSTTMCPVHRKKVIREVKELLNRGERVIVSSTQLIEAGVDMDFPVVYREAAPMESIIQAAGRCNREGKMPGLGIVSIFYLTDNSVPDKTYGALRDFANLSYKNREDRLLTHDIFTEYYRNVVDLFYDPDKYKINEKRIKFQFEDVANSYKLIDNTTTALFVWDYDSQSRELYEELKDKEFLSRANRRAINQYCVQVYDKFLKDNFHHIGLEKSGFLTWNGKYNEDTGLQSQIELDSLIF